MFGELLAQNFERPFNEFHFRLGLLYVIIPHGFFEPARRTLRSNACSRQGFPFS